LISTADGHKPIEKIKIGDSVYAWNEDSKKVEISKVINTMIHPDKKYGLAKFSNGIELKVTPEHPFYSKSQDKWIPIKEFEKGEKVLLLKNKRLIEIKFKSYKWDIGVANVYNITVEKNHNYFAEKVLVHNKVWRTCIVDLDPGTPDICDTETGPCTVCSVCYSCGACGYISGTYPACVCIPYDDPVPSGCEGTPTTPATPTTPGGGGDCGGEASYEDCVGAGHTTLYCSATCMLVIP
jgi:hypothetical protein